MLDESGFSNLLISEVDRFSVMFGNQKDASENGDYEICFSVPGDWRKLIEDSVRSLFFEKSIVRVNDEKAFYILLSFFSIRYNIITNEQCFELSDLLAEKLRLLSKNGYVSVNDEDANIDASEHLFSIFHQCVVLMKDNEIVNGFSVAKDGFEAEFGSLFDDIKTDTFVTAKVFGFLPVFAAGHLYKSLSAYDKLRFIISSINTDFCKTSVVSNTYLAIDSTGNIKIGRSSNFIAREKGLKVGNSTLKMLVVLKKDIETSLHKEYSNKHVIGEWYRLSHKDVDKILSENEVIWKNKSFDHLISAIK